MSVRDLTKGEALTIDRRRRGENQLRAAKRWKVSAYRLRQWESGEREDVPRVKLGRLKPHEICYVTRRRAGWSATDVAADMGVSRYWVSKMERGDAPSDALWDYWFPQAA